MTQPRRLVEEGTDFERGVLASARLDVASDAGLGRTLAAIGAGAAALSTTTASAGAGIVASGRAAALLAGVGAGAVVKWVGLASVIVCAGAVVTAVSFGPRGSARLEPRLQPAAVASAPNGLTPPREDSANAGVLAARVSSDLATPATSNELPDERPNTGSMGGRLARAAPPALAPPRASSSLDAQVAALDRVRAALATHQPERGLEDLDAYDRAFPRPVLAEEAAVLRVDALFDAGNRAAAIELARRFLAAHPGSAHAPRLRRLVGPNN